jgi:hypothetical protein
LAALAVGGRCRVRPSIGSLDRRVLVVLNIRRRCPDPGERLAVARNNVLDVDQLLDQLFKRVTVERELAAQGAQRDASMFLEVRLGLTDRLEEAHSHRRQRGCPRPSLLIERSQFFESDPR